MNSYSPFVRHCISEDNQTATSQNQFEDNYHGILTHRGEIKVAKFDVKQEILHIDDNGTVLVRGRGKAYITLIHAKLLPLIRYAERGDIGFIKFKRGEAFIVGFRKNKEMVWMSKPARLYPKPEPVNINPKLILIGSILFALIIGWIGISTSTYGGL